MKEVVELTILAMVMFLAAFFCLRVILVPKNGLKTIEKLNEVEDMVYKNE